jgi:phosphotriesterase-related protein
MTLSRARLSRRHAMRLLGTGAGLGLVGAWRGLPELLAQGKPAPIPSGAIIRTVFKDVPPSSINGHILFHEHLNFGSAFFEKMRPADVPKPATPPPPSYLENADIVADELKQSAKDGVALIVDGGHPDMATDYDFIKKVAEKAPGVLVVASGGYYLQTTYPPEIKTQSVDQLVDGLVRDAAKYRWGAFGEIGVSEKITDDERKVFQVMAKTQIKTNLPLFTHNPHSGCKECALEELDMLEKAGCKPASLCIGHLSDIHDDPNAESMKAIAKRGAFLGFDTVGHRIAQGDAAKVKLILKILEAGYEDYLLLSADFASEPEIKANGGAGYSSVSTVFLPKLRYAGVKDATIKKIMVDNPKRFLAFVPPKTT